MILEVCVNSAISALEAQKGGADRIELCENMHDGGTTPSAGTIRFTRKAIDIGLFVMIRPRGGDFLYSDAEFEIMKEDIRMAKKLGADGMVFGILLPEGRIDKERMKLLADYSRPMSVTCHRAFDMTEDPFLALDELIGIGIDRILTSGQKTSAAEGTELIKELIEKSSGRIIIMPGGGVKEYNIDKLIRQTGAKEIHVQLNKLETSRMIFHRTGIFMGQPGQPEFEYTITDWERIREIRKK